MSDIEVPVAPEDTGEAKLTRRAALARLGITAATFYVAPTILHIDRDARAFVVPSLCSTGRGRRRRRCKRGKSGKNKWGKSNKRSNSRRTTRDRGRSNDSRRRNNRNDSRRRRHSSWGNNRGNSRDNNRR